jgi:hypothetical protein
MHIKAQKEAEEIGSELSYGTENSHGIATDEQAWATLQSLASK